MVCKVVAPWGRADLRVLLPVYSISKCAIVAARKTIRRSRLVSLAEHHHTLARLGSLELTCSSPLVTMNQLRSPTLGTRMTSMAASPGACWGLSEKERTFSPSEAATPSQ